MTQAIPVLLPQGLRSSRNSQPHCQQELYEKSAPLDTPLDNEARQVGGAGKVQGGAQGGLRWGLRVGTQGFCAEITGCPDLGTWQEASAT